MNTQERNADLEQVIEKYSGDLYRTCFMILKNEQDTKDVLQETFLIYLTKRPDFTSETHKKAWLIKVSQNKCREFLRFHKRHARISLEDVEETLAITGDMDDEDREKLKLIWDLPYKLKSVVILHYVEGYTTKETAIILRISEAAVRKRLERARSELARLDEVNEGGMVYEQAY